MVLKVLLCLTLNSHSRSKRSYSTLSQNVTRQTEVKRKRVNCGFANVVFDLLWFTSQLKCHSAKCRDTECSGATEFPFKSVSRQSLPQLSLFHNQVARAKENQTLNISEEMGFSRFQADETIFKEGCQGWTVSFVR